MCTDSDDYDVTHFIVYILQFHILTPIIKFCGRKASYEGMAGRLGNGTKRLNETALQIPFLLQVTNVTISLQKIRIC